MLINLADPYQNCQRLFKFYLGGCLKQFEEIHSSVIIRARVDPMTLQFLFQMLDL